MNNAIYLTGGVLVPDILAALEPMVSEEVLAPLDKALEGQSDLRIIFDDCEVAVEGAIDALDDASKLPEPENLDYMLNQGEVMGLSEAIRCGDRETAELLLDKVFTDAGASAQVKEWIERGRYSRKARNAVAAARPAPRMVA